jgi:uncharacterized repeat protein (TIGR03803 family)
MEEMGVLRGPQISTRISPPADAYTLNWWRTGCAICVLCVATASAASGQTFESLVSFNGSNGGDPFYMTLVQATDGNLYGTTHLGGLEGDGTVFQMTPAGTFTPLYSFTNGIDSGFPFAGLVQGSDGSFYGTTTNGGGTVFEITAAGVLTTLYTFCPHNNCTTGLDYNPDAGLVLGFDGNFYGVAAEGGANNLGAVFRITPGGTLTTLHSFDGTDGSGPVGALTQAYDGSFYGTTISGGTGNSCSGGCGTVFRMTPRGTLTTLARFDLTNGSYPNGALVQGNDGNFYGTTALGGASNSCSGGCGTVFTITPGGTLTTLHSFELTDGGNPYAPLIQATDGNFYGTTAAGGASNFCTGGCGTVFKITRGGTLATLHSFDSTDGSYLLGGLVQDTNGTFYGETGGGGTFGHGTIFSLAVGLGPFVETELTSGAAGRPVRILGTNLTGATSVTFNGTAAIFKVVSASLITTTVPAGATTGKVQVITPSGVLNSNKAFVVKP